MKDTMTNFGDRFRELRNEKKLALEQIASSTALDLEYLKELENGFADPRITEINKIAMALSVTNYDLLDGVI